MSQFADMQRIAIFVVGRYRSELVRDPQLRQDWISAFQDFAIASYEDQFDSFGGAAIRVTGSVERIAGSDVIVDSEVRPPGQRADARAVARDPLGQCVEGGRCGRRQRSRCGWRNSSNASS